MLQETLSYKIGKASQFFSEIEQHKCAQPCIAVLHCKNGAEALTLMYRLRQAKSQEKVVLVLTEIAEELILELFRKGAYAIVLEKSHPDQLIAALKEAEKRRVFLCADLSRKLLEHLIQSKTNSLMAPEKQSLTRRESEIFYEIIAGKRHIEIARILNISISTVKSHRANIAKKIGASSLADFMQYARNMMEQNEEN